MSVLTVLGEDKSPLTAHNDPTLHLDPLNLVHMLIAAPKAVFVSICTPLVGIRSSMSAQLVSSDLLPGHGDASAEEVAGAGEDARSARRRQAEQAQSADRNTRAIPQAAVGTVTYK